MTMLGLVSGYSSRLKYRSLPAVPDQTIKEYLLGPLNHQLKSSERCQLFDEELANWFVSHFGGNFVDMKCFIENVLKKKIVDKEGFLASNLVHYDSIFMTAWKSSDIRKILDDLLARENLGFSILCEPTAKEYLIQNNIIALHSGGYIWNKRLARVAYEKFIQNPDSYRYSYSTPYYIHPILSLIHSMRGLNLAPRTHPHQRTASIGKTRHGPR